MSTPGSTATAELAEFIAKASAPGTAAYLPVLFAPDSHRELLGASFALRAEIGRSLAPDLAPEVASTRLSWWGEEAGQIVAGQPRHPLSRRLVAAIDGCALEDPRALGVLLAEMVGAAQATLSEPLPATWDALSHRLRHDWGALCRLMSRLQASPSKAAEEWHDLWGNGLGLACAIDEALSATAPDNLPTLSPDPGAVGEASLRLSAWRSHALQELSSALRALPHREREAQRPLLVLASLVSRRLIRPTPPGEHGKPHLPQSLGELWCAWRAAQQAARGKIPAALRRAAAVDSAP